MKEKLLSTIILLFCAFGLNAQKAIEDDENCDKAATLIEQAAEYASKELYTIAVDNLEKAYDLSPSQFGCSTFQLMGISYYMISNYSSAIEILEQSTECETNIDVLSFIYGTLADSYRKEEDYYNAILSAEKLIYISEDDDVISGAYEILAYVYFAQDNYNKTVESFDKTIHHYLKYLSATDEDVMRNKVKDDMLGEYYIKFSALYSEHGKTSEAEKLLVKSALCGYEPAIEICKNLRKEY